MRNVGVRELRQNLSRHLKRVKAGESLVVTERGREVAMLVPSGASQADSTRLAMEFSATVPIARLDQVAAKLEAPGAPAGTTDAFLAESRSGRG